MDASSLSPSNDESSPAEAAKGTKSTQQTLRNDFTLGPPVQVLNLCSSLLIDLN